MRRSIIAALACAGLSATSCGPADSITESCLQGCELSNDPFAGCGVSNYDCSAVCAESRRIASGTGCTAETAAFWRCLATQEAGAVCRATVCPSELASLDACVARAPSTDCLRACVLCGDSGYSTCAVGCARRDAHALLMGCDAAYAAYYACRLRDGLCAPCLAESQAFSMCWSSFCGDQPLECPVTP